MSNRQQYKQLEIGEDRHSLEDLHNKYAEARKNYYSTFYVLKSQISKRIGVQSIDIELGDWKCENSPTGWCVYNSHIDPAHDDCLFCHEPEERK